MFHLRTLIQIVVAMVIFTVLVTAIGSVATRALEVVVRTLG
ncbi:MAG: hypothetical protein ACWGQW_03130 [bacterium]